ncbi:CMGC protein kinase [Annulohypoxylon moriforme]|nr:CMGC protein kinase [Annulohypoxylon moriforme]
MASKNRLRSIFSWSSITRKKPLTPRIFPTTGFETIDESYRIEEERMSIYKPEIFYPVRIGEVFQDRYQVVTKLGFGSSSTIWLCHDLLDRRYAALKVHVNTIKNNRELQVFKHLKEVGSRRLSKVNIRQLKDSFKIQGPHGIHDVFVQPPLGVCLRDFQDKVPNNVFNTIFVQAALNQVLPALNFLHIDANVIHTDFHTGNLLIGIKDESKLIQVEDAEIKSPPPRKEIGDRTIYVSRAMIGNTGPLFLCDFGEARIGREQSGTAMPTSYRAPEVILGMKWGYPVDMWSVALVAWDLLESKNLFNFRHVHDQDLNDACHLADMIALLGPPPLEFLKRSEDYLKFWDADGNWRGIVPIPQERTIESLEKTLEGSEREDFLVFLRALLQWVPEERLTAKQAMSHPWLDS